MAMQPEALDLAPEPKFVGVQYAATTTGLSRGSIYALVANGTIRSARFVAADLSRSRSLTASSTG